jgi:hypothetical protein
VLSLIKLLFFIFPSFAQLANYNSILLGDRSAGMGGAATALLEDASSGAFFNPATLAMSESSTLSAAVGIYKKYDTQYGSESDYTQTPFKINTGFFRSLPASTGSMIRKEGWTFGLSILVPEYETFKGDLQSTTANTSTLTYLDESLWVGGMLSRKTSASESWGLTLYYTARNFNRSIQDRTYPNTSEAILYSSEETVTENSIVPIIGYLKKHESGWLLGSSLRLRGIAVASDATFFENRTTTNPYSSSEVNQLNLKTDVFIPAKISIGASKVVNNYLEIAMTADLYEGRSYSFIDLPSKGTYVVRQAIANFSIGSEWTFKDWLKLRSGIFTNISPYPDPDPTLKKYQGEHIDQAGFSANLVFIADNKIAYTFGGYYSGGRGRAIERINQDFEVVTKSQHIFTMLVGTHFYF